MQSATTRYARTHIRIADTNVPLSIGNYKQNEPSRNCQIVMQMPNIGQKTHANAAETKICAIICNKREDTNQLVTNREFKANANISSKVYINIAPTIKMLT